MFKGFIMNKDMCGHYKKKKPMNNKNLICIHFNGDVNMGLQMSNCRHYCECYKLSRR
jgi:hypothetical protein